MLDRVGIARAFEIEKDKLRGRLLKYTREAFGILPKIHNPRILDIGCGTGIPTIELAKLSKGQIIGIDIDQPALARFGDTVSKLGLSDRIQVLRCSMFDLTFSLQNFDVIWSEGSIYVIGFDRGLKEWKQFLKPYGFMVIHDEQGDISQKIKRIHQHGYELLRHFLLNENIWCIEYFTPLKELINKFRRKYPSEQILTEPIRKAQQEVDIFQNYPKQNSSVYFIIRKLN